MGLFSSSKLLFFLKVKSLKKHENRRFLNVSAAQTCACTAASCSSVATNDLIYEFFGNRNTMINFLYFIESIIQQIINL